MIRPRLGDQHYGVSSTAVDAYARHARLSAAESRVELADLLPDARQQRDPDVWRVRSRSSGLDLSIRTTYDRDRGHLVVIGVSARELPAQRRRARPAAPAAVTVAVDLSASDHATIAAELRGDETVADVLRTSGLATARARARARGRS